MAQTNLDKIALRSDAKLPAELVRRQWELAVKEKDWDLAAAVAGREGNPTDVEEQVVASPNAQVRAAWVRRPTVPLDTIISTLIDETRSVVLAALVSRGKEDPRVLPLVISAAKNGKAKVSIAQLLLDVDAGDELDSQTAAELICSLTGKTLKTARQATLVKWVKNLHGQSASTVADHWVLNKDSLGSVQYVDYATLDGMLSLLEADDIKEESAVALFKVLLHWATGDSGAFGDNPTSHRLGMFLKKGTYPVGVLKAFEEKVNEFLQKPEDFTDKEKSSLAKLVISVYSFEALTLQSPWPDKLVRPEDETLLSLSVADSRTQALQSIEVAPAVRDLFRDASSGVKWPKLPPPLMKALGGAESRSYLSRSEDVPNNNYGSNIGHLYYTMACNTLDGQASYACAREKLRANQPPAIHVLARAYAYNSQAVLSQVFKIDREPSRTTALWTQVVPMLSVMRVEGEETEPIRPDLIKAMQQMDTMNVHHSSTDSAWYGFAKIYPDILGERDWVKLYSVTVNEANWYYHLTGKLRVLFLEELAKWIESFEEPERTWSLVNSIAGTFAGTFNELKVLVEDMYKQA